MPLLVGGPLSGQVMDMPDDKIVASVLRPDGKYSPYARTRIHHDDQEVEVWGWAPLCYRRVKALYLHIQEEQ